MWVVPSLVRYEIPPWIVPQDVPVSMIKTGAKRWQADGMDTVGGPITIASSETLDVVGARRRRQEPTANEILVSANNKQG